MNAISQRIAPNEKNQNGSAVHRCWVTVARAKAVKNVWVKIAQIGRRKIAEHEFHPPRRHQVCARGGCATRCRHHVGRDFHTARHFPAADQSRLSVHRCDSIAKTLRLSSG